MKPYYKVWIDLEEIDEDNDHYQSLDLMFGATATFRDEEEGREAAAAVHAAADAILDGSHALVSHTDLRELLEMASEHLDETVHDARNLALYSRPDAAEMLNSVRTQRHKLNQLSRTIDS